MNKQTPKFVAYIFPTFGNMLWMATFLAVLLRGQRMINADGDLALHLNLGKYILNTGNIPLRDVFSHTLTGKPVIQHEWLSAVILEGIKRFAGLRGVIFLLALVISTAMYLLFRHLRKNNQTLLPVLLALLLTIVNSIIHWLARPHIFSFLFLILWLMMLEKLRAGTLKNWWMLPLSMLLWVNMHGGFIIGFITWIIFGFGVGWEVLFQKGEEKSLSPGFWRTYLIAGCASFLASLLNPSGIGLWKKVVTHVGSKYLADVTSEFQSPNFHDASYWPFIIYIGLILVGLGLSKKKYRSDRLFMAAAWLIMGLYSVRNIPLFAITAAPLLAQALDNLLINAPDNIKPVHWIKNMDHRLEKTDNQLKGFLWPILSILIAVLGIIFGVGFQTGREMYTFDPEVFPVEAVDWLKENPQEGEMFNYFTWGGYMEYRLWPEERVFIDSKSDFFGEDFVRQYGKVILQQDEWEDVLEMYDVDWAILPVDEPASKAIKEELGWEVVYKDNTAVIFIRH